MQRTPPTAGTAVVVGNGSSVDAMPEGFWDRCFSDDVLLVGTNRVLCSRGVGHLPWDALVIRDTYRNLWHDQRWGAQYHEQLWKPHAAWKVGPAYWRVTHCDQYLRFVGEWQAEPSADANGELAVMKNPSVVLMAANWAWLQGARQIVLVGVDYRGRHFEMAEPYTVSTGLEGRYDAPSVPERIEVYFRDAGRAVRRLGGRLVNVSPGTILQGVEVALWEDALG